MFIISYRAMQNNSDILAATLLKWNNKNNSTWVNFNLFTFEKQTFSSSVFSVVYFKIVVVKRTSKTPNQIDQKCKKGGHFKNVFEN